MRAAVYYGPNKLEIALTVTSDGRTDTTTVVLEDVPAPLGPLTARPAPSPSGFLR